MTLLVPSLLRCWKEETGLDRYTLARSFRNRFGTSPHRYLVGRRLERVRAEIARDASLADAAYAVGFADQSHMTRHFKARFGLTPGHYAVLLRSRDRAYQAK
jgi:AraC-like DNA-binding protein